jgi:spore maturation protein CgeB
MRLFIAYAYDRRAVEAFYAARPGLASASHAEQRQVLWSELFVGTDFWSRELAVLEPDWAVEEVVINLRPLQEAWARENGLQFSAENWMGEIAVAQAAQFRPDVLFTRDHEFIDAGFRRELISAGGPKLVLGWDGIARCDPARFSGCDLLLSNFDFVADFYRGEKFRGVFFPYSLADQLVSLGETNGPDMSGQSTGSKLTFAGSVVVRSDLHVQRLFLLNELAKKLPLELRAAGNIGEWRWWERPQRRRLRKGQWATAAAVHRLGQRNTGPLHGVEMFKYLAGSPVTLNVHIDNARNRASNMRLFEATGMGACLLTDGSEGLEEFFVEGKEVVGYRSAAEAVEKATYLLEHPEEAAKIGQAGRERVLREHLFSHRWPELRELLLAELKQR